VRGCPPVCQSESSALPLSSADAGSKLRVAGRRAAEVAKVDFPIAAVTSHTPLKQLIWRGHPSMLNSNGHADTSVRDSVKSPAFSIRSIVTAHGGKKEGSCGPVWIYVTSCPDCEPLFGGLISVRSVVQVHPGPLSWKKEGSIAGLACADRSRRSGAFVALDLRHERIGEQNQVRQVEKEVHQDAGFHTSRELIGRAVADARECGQQDIRGPAREVCYAEGGGPDE